MGSSLCSSTVDVTLDGASAHPNLLLSEDQKEVRWINKPWVRKVSGPQQNFDVEPYVLGTMGLSLRSYWEVSVEDKNDWFLGVTLEEAQREGRLDLNPPDGFWVIMFSSGRKLTAMDGTGVVLQNAIPKKVGIYLDYDEKKVVFYNADDASIMYTFRNGPGRGQRAQPLFSPGNSDEIPIRILSLMWNRNH